MIIKSSCIWCGQRKGVLEFAPNLFAPQLHEGKNFASNVCLSGRVVFMFAHIILLSYHCPFVMFLSIKNLLQLVDRHTSPYRYPASQVVDYFK